MKEKHWDERLQTWICPRDKNRMKYRSSGVGETYDYSCKTCNFRYGDFSSETFEEKAKRYRLKIEEETFKPPRHVSIKQRNLKKGGFLAKL